MEIWDGKYNTNELARSLHTVSTRQEDGILEVKTTTSNTHRDVRISITGGSSNS